MIENKYDNNYIINDNLKQNIYNFNDNEYKKIYRELLFNFIDMNAVNVLIKITGVFFETMLLSELRENILYGTSTSSHIISILIGILILLLIESDKLSLNEITQIKQELKFIKEQKSEALKKLSKTIK